MYFALLKPGPVMMNNVSLNNPPSHHINTHIPRDTGQGGGVAAINQLKPINQP